MMNFINKAAHSLTTFGFCRVLRLLAYCKITGWVHDHLDRAVRKVIPASVISLIRRTFPEPSAMYNGYEEAVGALPYP